MGDRRYGMGSRGRSAPSRRPPARSRDYDESRHCMYSPYHRGTEDYSREAERSRRIEKRGGFGRSFDLRGPGFPEYDNRDRDSYAVGDRRSRSPLRIGKRDNFDAGVSARPVTLPEYDGEGKGKYKNELSFGRSSRSYNEDSYRGGDLSSMKFRSDHLKVKDGSFMPDYHRVGNTDIARADGGRDDYQHSHYMDSGQPGLLTAPRYLDSKKPISLEYEKGGMMYSNPYALAHGGIGDIPRGNLNGGDGSSHGPSVASRYLNNDTNKQGYVLSWDELLEKRDGEFRDREDLHFEKRTDGFHFQDGPLGIEKTAGREICKFKKEDNLLPSASYLKGESDYMASSSQPKDYVSVPPGILRESYLDYSHRGENNLAPHVIRPGIGLTSESVAVDGYRENKQNMYPRPGARLDDIRSSSGLYVGHPEQLQGHQSYAEFGRSKIKSIRPNDVDEEYKEQLMERTDVLYPTIDESSYNRYMRDDEQWEQYPFSRLPSRSDKFDESGSLLRRKQDLEILGTESYGTEGYQQYRSVKPEEHHAEGGGSQWSNGERSNILQSRFYDPSFERLYNSPRKRFDLDNLSLAEPSQGRFGQKHVRDEILFEDGVGIRISTDGNGARKIYNQVDEGDEIDIANLLDKPRSSKSKCVRTRGESSKMANHQPSSSRATRRHSINLPASDSRDIKKRLGPVPGKLHVSQRLGKKYKPSIKKRLGPARRKRRDTLPWLKNVHSNQKAGVEDGSSAIPYDPDGDQLGD